MEEIKLRTVNEEEMQASIQGALALRPEIERIIDEIFQRDIHSVYFVGIGGTLASAMMAECYTQGKTTIDIRALSASEYLTNGSKRINENTLFIYSSVSGNTKEMVEMTQKAKEDGVCLFAFVDKEEETPLSKIADYCIHYPKNEQLKFFMVCNYLMYRNHEFDDYDAYNQNMEEYLAKALISVAKECDAWAKDVALNKVEQLKTNKDMPHYFVAAGTQYGATISHGMCYWEEQLWIRTRVVHAAEFFHGCFEVIEEDTPVTLFIEEGPQRPLSLRVQNFLERINHNHVYIDSKDYALEGIKEEYRPSITHLVFRVINDRIDAYLEYYLNHSLDIRRYYRKMEY